MDCYKRSLQFWNLLEQLWNMSLVVSCEMILPLESLEIKIRMRENSYSRRQRYDIRCLHRENLDMRNELKSEVEFSSSLFA